MAARKKYFETEIGKLIDNQFDSRVQSSLFVFIMQEGTENLKNMTDEQIEEYVGNKLMSTECVQALVRTARDICTKFSITEIMKYIKNYVHFA